MSFQKGDVVQLKSGGPKMTVAWCEEEHGVLTAYCQWFDGTKQLHGTFPPESLKKVDENEKPAK
jgi:uncharacterized protein YodC (DUF2158 family)